MALVLVGEKIDRNRFTGEKIENSTFFNCDFSVPTLARDLSAVSSMIVKARKGANFSRAMLKDAIFKSCDLSMADFAIPVRWALKFATAAHKAQISAAQAL